MLAFSRSPHIIVTAAVAFLIQLLCELYVQLGSTIDWPQTIGGAVAVAAYFAVMVGPWPGRPS